MSTHSLRSLIVDDDSIVRRTVAFALTREGFECTMAEDGVVALQKAAITTFDLIVTDLSMPNMHGHSLVVELKKRQSKSVLVIHSSIDDSRIAKDLLTRGVDDIVYKPTNYASFATKMRILVDRRRNEAQPPAPKESIDLRREGRKFVILLLRVPIGCRIG